VVGVRRRGVEMRWDFEEVWEGEGVDLVWWRWLRGWWMALCGFVCGCESRGGNNCGDRLAWLSLRFRG